MRDRVEFAKRLSSITEGMSKDALIALIGAPDDVRNHSERGVHETNHVDEVWCYGTNGHLTLPTLGHVYLNQLNKVQFVVGAGNPIGTELFEEKELRDVLRVLDTAPSVWGDAYDPLPLIQIVNRLRAMGKDKALAAIAEYLRIAPGWNARARDGQFLILRVLFDLQRPGEMPEMKLGTPWPTLTPVLKARMPRYPILLLDDVPLVVITGYQIIGKPQSVREHLEYFRQLGTVRSRPLLPPKHPLRLFQKFHSEFPHFFGTDESSTASINGKLMIMNQLLRLVASVYPLEVDSATGYRFRQRTDLAEGWKVIADDFEMLGARWSQEKQVYVLPGGSQMPNSRPMCK
jgi:hypothetical protein